MAEFNAEFYNNAFNVIVNTLPKKEFDETWCNGTGYLDNLANKVFDDRVPFAAVDNNDRKIIAIPHHEGTVVIFQRYTGGEGPLIAHYARSTYHPKTRRFWVDFTAAMLMDEDAQSAQNALTNLYFHVKK